MVGGTWQGLTRSWVTASAAAISMAITLFLLGGALLLDAQLAGISGFWVGDEELSLFVCDGCTDAVVADLSRDPRVAHVTVDEPQAAYHRLVENIEGRPNPFGRVSPRGLPGSIRVDLGSSADVQGVVADYEGHPRVRAIVDRGAALGFSRGLLEVARFGALLWAAVQTLAVTVLVANTILQSIHVRRDELTIMSLVGAARWQVYLPLAAQGWVLSIVGWALAWTALALSWPRLAPTLTGEIGTVVTPRTAPGLGAALLALGVAISTITCAVAVRHASGATRRSGTIRRSSSERSVPPASR